MADNFILFNNISVGRKFQTPGKIIYQKINNQECIPVLTGDNQSISNPKISKAFLNSIIPLIIVS